MTRISVWLATVGGAGYCPIAPGTVGSAVGVVVYVFTRHLPLPEQLAIILAISLVGIWASTRAEQHFGRQDPGEVVIDEVAGQLVTLFATGVGIRGMVLGFLLFRVLDIIKPYPANRFERLHGGLGIMADDLMAGVYGNLLLMAAFWLAPALR